MLTVSSDVKRLTCRWVHREVNSHPSLRARNSGLGTQRRRQKQMTAKSVVLSTVLSTVSSTVLYGVSTPYKQ